MHSLKIKVTVITVITLVILAVYPASAALNMPSGAQAVFLQTTGRLAPLDVGDYRTNTAGDNQDHELVVNIPCTPSQTYVFELFDPSIDIAQNPPGITIAFMPDGTPRALDEPRITNQNLMITSPNMNVANAFFDALLIDPATFRLLQPNGVQVATQTFATGSADGLWVTLHTLTLPAAPTAGVNCGDYTLISRVGDGSAAVGLNNDDNGWRFRLSGGAAVPAETFDPVVGFDGIAGTGDEAWVALQSLAYQHFGAGGCGVNAPQQSQTFYWFSNFGNTNMRMLNFDMDNQGFVEYYTPAGTLINGTVSTFFNWNSTPLQTPRPAFGNMATFDPGVGDTIGDAIANPETGLWSARVCLLFNNEYVFEVPGAVLFLNPPPLPNVGIQKVDAFNPIITSPGTTTYTISITNSGAGAAMPIPGPEVVDNLPAGMTFVSCTVNPPLVGTCSNSGNTVNFNLTGQAGIAAYLPGTPAAPNNTGTMTVTANVNAGLADGSLLTNTATVNYTDVFGNTHPPSSASDTNEVDALPVVPTPTSIPGSTTGTGGVSPAIALVDPFITKSVNPPFALPGEAVTWTIIVSNPGTIAINNVVMTDNMPPEVEILSVSATAGSASFSGQTVTTNIGTLAPGQSVTTTVNAQVRANAALPFILTNNACMTYAGSTATHCAQATVLSVAQLPATGETPPWRDLLLVSLLTAGISIVSLSGGSVLRSSRKHHAA